MRFLEDENFPYPAVDRLRQRGHDAVAVRDIMRGATDEEVQPRDSTGRVSATHRW